MLGKKAPPPPVKKPSVEVQEDTSKSATAEPVSKESSNEMPAPAEEQPENALEGVTSPSRIPLPTSPPVTSPPLLVGPKRAAPPRKKRPTPTSVPAAEKEVDPIAEAGAQADSVHPEEVALPPSRSTTLDIDKVASPEPVPIEEKKEAEEEAGTVTPPAGSSAEPAEPIGHARLQSIATDSLAETDEAATPPPRSVTPSEDDDGERYLQDSVEDTMAGLQIRPQDGVSIKTSQPGHAEEKRVPSLDAVPTSPSHELAANTPTQLEHTSSLSTISPSVTRESASQIASRVNVEDPMEHAQLTSEPPEDGTSHEKAEAAEKVEEHDREEGMS